MKRNTERIEFQTAAQLIAAIEKLTGGLINLEEIYVKDVDGVELGLLELEQEVLSDGSIVFNLILSESRDPNS